MPNPSPARPRIVALALLAALGGWLTACDRPTQFLAGTPTPPPEAPTATAVLLPDLIILSAELVIEDNQPCFEPGDQLEVILAFQNSGQAPANEFALKLGDLEVIIEQGLKAGESQTLILPAIGSQLSAQIDTRRQVVESNENNNHLSAALVAPTASPACFPTPVKEIPEVSVQSALAGHQGRVLSLDFSPDGRLLVSAGVDNTMRLWRVSQLSLLRTMQGHPFPITQVSFSPNGQQIATGSVDSVARIWRVDNASLLSTLAGHADWITSLAYSPDGRMVATGSRDFTVRLWRSANGSSLALIDEGMTGITSLAFNPVSGDLAWGETGGAVRIWQVQNEAWLHVWNTGEPAACCVTFSPGGESLAAGFGDGAIRIWDTTQGDQLGILHLPSTTIHELAFSPDGRFLAAAVGDGDIYLWLWQKLLSEDFQSSAADFILRGNQVLLNDIDIAPDSSLLAAAGDDGSVLLWALPAP